MGGWGSGRKSEGKRKKTVNESCTLPIKQFSAALSTGDNKVKLCCRPWRGNHFVFLVGINHGSQSSMTVQFFPRLRNVEAVAQHILLEKQTMEFCDRWWFRCPIENDGFACGKRVAKLHLPIGGKLFGCRECHDLRYISSQKAHEKERLEKAEPQVEDFLERVLK